MRGVAEGAGAPEQMFSERSLSVRAARAGFSCGFCTSSGGVDVQTLVCIAAAQYETPGTGLFAVSGGSQLCQLDRENTRSCAIRERAAPTPTPTPTLTLKHTSTELSLAAN